MLIPLLFAAISIPQTGRVELPPGDIELTAPLVIPAGAHDLVVRGNPAGTLLRLSANFQGAAAIECRNARNIRIEGLSIDGRRTAFAERLDLPPSNVAFAVFFKRNGILASTVIGLTVSRVRFREMWGFAVLVHAGRGARLDSLDVAASGSRNPRGRNNTTGGVLIEEGTADFEVTHSRFEGVLGNGVWTHSNYGSPRNTRGRISGNHFREIGRDAIQVGHASHMRVSDNSGSQIGYPFDAVDIEIGATPVAIDTSGDVDSTIYTRNAFSELNGKCIDLDGFHDGEVSLNRCINRGRAEDYPFGHYSIVVNNWNPDMKSQGIRIVDNLIEGSKFGGIFLLGSNHIVMRNCLLNLNLAKCNESAQTFGCVAIQGEPDVLRAGIYLGRIAAEWAQKRADTSRGHLVQENVISGFKMDERCVMIAHGVDAQANTVSDNVCLRSLQ